MKRWQKTDRPAPRQGAGSGRRGVGLRARLEASAPPQGAFSHENYPSKEIEACLAACREAAVRRGPIGRRLRAQVESCAREHAELAEELAAFSRRTEELRLRIIALTAAAKPLQEPGIGAGDREAMREELARRAQALRQEREAYQREADALEARIAAVLGRLSALFSRAGGSPEANP